MGEWFAALSPVTFLCILVFGGFVAEKTGIVSELSNNLSRFITNISLPILIIVSLSDQNINQISAPEIITIIFIGIVSITSLIFINRIVGKLLHVPQNKLLLHSFIGSFGNVIYLAYPFVLQLYGERGLLYAILFSIVNELLLWSVGVYSLIRDSRTDKAIWSIKYLLNPNTMAFLLGILMFICSIKFPDLIHAPLESLGAATIPLSMMFIGSVLARTNIRNAVKAVSIWSVVLVKMLLAPLLFLFFIWLIGADRLQGYQVMLSVVVLQIAMPTQTNLSVIAHRYQADSEYAAQAILVTTVTSTLSLPLMFLLSKFIFLS